jgi:hypothetical protein
MDFTSRIPLLSQTQIWNGCEKRRGTVDVAGEVGWVITPLEVQPDCVGNASPHGGVGTRPRPRQKGVRDTDERLSR